MRLLPTFLLGLAAGLRSMTAPAAAAAARRARSAADHAPLKFLDDMNAPAFLVLLAIGEMIADKLPFMPDRKAPPAFAWRITTGALSAAMVTGDEEALVPALIAGAAGAAAGTLAGSALRSRLAELFDKDLPAALVEDALVLAIAAFAARSLERAHSVPQP